MRSKFSLCLLNTSSYENAPESFVKARKWKQLVPKESSTCWSTLSAFKMAQELASGLVPALRQGSQFLYEVPWTGKPNKNNISFQTGRRLMQIALRHNLTLFEPREIPPESMWREQVAAEPLSKLTAVQSGILQAHTNSILKSHEEWRQKGHGLLDAYHGF